MKLQLVFIIIYGARHIGTCNEGTPLGMSQLLSVLAEVLQMFTVYYELFYKLILYYYVVIFICEDLASFCHCVFHVINSYRHLFHNY